MAKLLDYTVESEEIVEIENGKKEILAVLRFPNGGKTICHIPYGRTFEEEKKAWLDGFTIACFKAFRPGYDLSGQKLTLILRDKEDDD